MSIFSADLAALDIENVGAWPFIMRLFCIVGVCILIGVGFFYIDLYEQWQAYQRLQNQRKEQEMIFIEKQSQIAHLDVYKAQMKTVQEKFEILKQHLPNAKEEAEFLEVLSQQASAAGLHFVSIKPLPAEKKDFYKELALELKLSGPYHGIGTFVDQLSKMPRMVTFHDLNLKLDQTEKIGTGRIELSVLIKIYWVDKLS